jgi:DNA-binding NarL/FixJ family response regulator
MKILLWCDDLMTRMRLESAWKAAGATVLKKKTTEAPDCIVIDLAVRRVLEHIRELRASHPQTDIIAFGPHFDGDAFKEAKAAGATEVAARGSVIQRITRRMPN